MGYTSNDVKMRWIKDNYKQYKINFRYDTDAALIDYIERHKAQFGTTELFRRGVELLIESGEFG